MKTLLALSLLLLLVGCTTKSTTFSSTTTNESSQKLQSIEQIQTSSNILRWVYFARSKIERYLGDISPYIGDFIEIEVEIDKDGNLKVAKVLQHSRSKKLEKIVLDGVARAAPFNTSMLSSQEFEQVNIMKISFNFN